MVTDCTHTLTPVQIEVIKADREHAQTEIREERGRRPYMLLAVLSFGGGAALLVFQTGLAHILLFPIPYLLMALARLQRHEGQVTKSNKGFLRESDALLELNGISHQAYMDGHGDERDAGGWQKAIGLAVQIVQVSCIGLILLLFWDTFLLWPWTMHWCALGAAVLEAYAVVKALRYLRR